MASITDHVIKLQELTQKNLDILQALNDSFFTNQNHLSVNIGEQQYAIPSFISLENKLNSLTANFENLVKSPETGEAFFDFNGNSRAIQVRSYSETPNSLILNPITEFNVETNNIFKDFLTPNPYIHLDVQSLPNDTTQVLVKKVIPIHPDLTQLFKSVLKSTDNDDYKISVKYNYKDLYKVLDSYTPNVDYIEYDSKLDLPIRKNIGSGVYVIEEIVEDVIDENLDNFLTIKLRTDVDDSIYMNSLKYRLFDETIEKMLKIGDELVTYEGNAKLSITEIRPQTNTIVVKVLHGEFLNLVPSITNNHHNISSLSKLKFYSPIDFDNDKYIKVSLEEDRYIFTAVAALNSRMNVQSSWGSGLIIDTYSLMYKDNNFQTYYKENVKNVGDILLEITNMTSTPLTKYTPDEYNKFMQYQPEINVDNLQVVQINKHLNNSIVVQNIRSLYAQKIELQKQLNEIQLQVNEINETLSSISFDDTTGRRTAYIQSLSSLNVRRNELNTSITKVINEISLAANNSDIPIENAKYRIRGYFDISNITELNDHIKGIRVQYRYKNADSAQNSAYTINDKFIFSDWNEMHGSDRERISIYDKEYKSQLSPVNDNINEPSFNQIDIPISQGETVDIRLKLVYDYGYPFVQTSSLWSPIVNIEFPSEFLKDIKILDIISENNNDIETNRFNNIIKEEGIPEHIGDKLTDQDITYFHKPENIASGFYTPERRIIPLKDKLTELSNLIIKLQDEVLGSNTDKLTVSIKNGDKYIPLTKFDNNIVYLDPYSKIKNNEATGNYTMQDNGLATTILNLSLANNSDHIIKLHSIFPGSRDIAINHFASMPQNNLVHYTTGNLNNLKEKYGVWIDIPVEGNYLNVESNSSSVTRNTNANKTRALDSSDNYINEYFTIEAQTDALYMHFKPSGLNRTSNKKIHYRISTDGIDWSNWTTCSLTSTTMDLEFPVIHSGYRLQIKANLSPANMSSITESGDPYDWRIEGLGIGSVQSGSNEDRYEVSGNIMSLLYEDDFSNYNKSYEYCFANLFLLEMGLTNAGHLILPATILSSYCYYNMFSGCEALEIAPKLPATNLAENCYDQMFSGCSSLIVSPKLPATNLVKGCYNEMFYYCSSLNYIDISAKNIDENTSDYLTMWVKGVSSEGDFYKLTGVNIKSGDSGIPNGWTVHEYDLDTPGGDSDTPGVLPDPDDNIVSGTAADYNHIITEIINNNIISRQMLQTGNQYLYFRIDDIVTYSKYYSEKLSDGSNFASDLVPTNNLLSINPDGIKWSRFNAALASKNDGREWLYSYIDNETSLINNKVMFVYPKLTSKYGLCVDKDESNMILYPNDEIIIPIVVEFCVQRDSDKSSISKTMSFDIRPSLYKDPINYKFTIVSKYENTIQEDILANQQESYNKSNSKYNIIFK